MTISGDRPDPDLLQVTDTEIQDARREALSIVRGEVPLTDGAVQRAQRAVAAEDARYAAGLPSAGFTP